MLFLNLTANYILLLNQFQINIDTQNFNTLLEIFNWPLIDFFTNIDFNFFNFLNEFMSIKSKNSIIDTNVLTYINKSLNYTDDMLSLYTYSVPNLKLYYPEPFVATGNFSHSDLWFIHISIYQYWLWFFFIFLIIFFTTSFIITLHWCNIRIKPSRETRGVSRSKCGDLITASVPVSWAGSIIIHESTDAVDFYDGFGTSEMAVGIRAYQWGWEYYYPKDIDIQYNTTNFNNYFVGNSLYYTSESENYEEVSKFFEHYKIKHVWDSSITPAHLICFSTKFNDTLKLISFKNFGYSKLIKQNAFKHILSSRHIDYNLTLDYDYFNDKYLKNTYLFKLVDLYIQNITTPTLHTKQHEYLSLSALFNYHSSFSNLKTLNKYLELNANKKTNVSFNETYVNNSILLKNNYFLNNLLIFNKNELNNQKIIFDDIYLFTKNFLNNDFNSFNLSNFNLKFIDKNYKIFITENTKHANFMKFVWNTKKTNIDSSLITELNYINTTPKFNLYNNNFVNGSNTLFLNLNNNLLNYSTNLYYNLNLNLIDVNTTLSNLKTTNVINSVKSPFKPTNPYSNLFLLNNFNKPFSLTVPADNWNNDFFYTNYITKNTKTNFNTFKFLNKLDNINTLSKSRLLTPFLFGDYGIKRVLQNKLIESVLWDLNYDDESYSNQLETIHKWNQTSFIDDAYEYIATKNSTNNDNLDIIDFFVSTSDTVQITNNNNSINFLNFKNKSLLNYTYIPKYNFNFMILNDNINDFLVNSFSNFKELTTLYSNYNFNNLVILNSLKFVNDIQTLLPKYWLEFDSLNFSTNTLNSLNKFNLNTTKFNTNYSLIDSVKTIMQIETAVGRFYRSTFDENRSFINFDNFSSSFTKLPFINKTNTHLKKYINKNYLSFIKSNLYLIKNNLILNTKNHRLNSLTTFTFNFPFTIASESDVLKYSWFDWYSNYNKRTAKQLDLNDYISNGVKIFKNKYDYALSDVNAINNKDNYLSRLSHSRKNYLPSWTYTPFLLNRTKTWTKDYINYTNLFENLDKNNDIKLQFWLTFMNWYDDLYHNFNTNEIINFNGTNSGLFTPARNYTKSVNTLSSYNYFISSLTDVLTKREYLIRQLLTFNNISTSFTKQYITSPYNTIILDWKSNILLYSNIEKQIIENNNQITNFYISSNLNKHLIYLIQKTIMNFKHTNHNLWLYRGYDWTTKTPDWFSYTCSSTYTYYNNLFQILKFDLFLFNWLINQTNSYFSYFKLFDIDVNNNNITSKFQQLNEKLNNWFVNEFISKTMNFKTNYEINNNKVFYKKTQYKHMRKSMSNMIRIQNDKAVAMPVDTRIQFLTVSKDIIHSWAVPSAGIKIDCIPGYSSHKITIFFLSGIYWGQCMEICGRYHHWMPIVVYFMKRDLFMLWCIHFVSSTKNNTNLISSQITKNNNDLTTVVSYPISSWENEIYIK